MIKIIIHLLKYEDNYFSISNKGTQKYLEVHTWKYAKVLTAFGV